MFIVNNKNTRTMSVMLWQVSKNCTQRVVANQQELRQVTSQLTFTCSKSTIETLENL